MITTLQTLVVLLAVIVAIAVVAERLKIPASILLVITGVGLALIPGLPPVELAPEFVLLIVLPPLIYISAVAMSWREFRFNLRPIALLAIGCVLFTAAVVAAVAHYLLGFSWALGFVLGAIVSPPDAVAPLSIARRMQLPRRILVVLEGEGRAAERAHELMRALGALGCEATLLPTQHPVVDIVYFHLLVLAEAAARGVDPDPIRRLPGTPWADAGGSAYSG